jgi:8-oxo-dGTP pyrophosphatase MutT (NUDIX family)
MHNFEETGYEKGPRAGMLPYIRGEDGAIQYLMMISSDPKFGGPRPMLSKGKIEGTENAWEAAMREAEEELGLVPFNIRNTTLLCDEHRVELYSCAYQLTLYMGEVIDRGYFEKWGDETAYTQWMTLEEFRAEGRRDHVKYVELAEERLKNG